MHRNWTTQNVPFPGSVKPVYGAQYPPLKQSGGGTDIVECPSKSDQRFRNYEKSVSDVWDPAVSMDDTLILSTAAKVLESHAAAAAVKDDRHNEDAVMPNCYPIPQKHNKMQAMQRLATQRAGVGSAVHSGTSPTSTASGFNSTAIPSIYPRLPEVSLSRPMSSAPMPQSKPVVAPNKSHQQHLVPGSAVPLPPPRTQDIGNDISRFDRLRRILGLHQSGDGRRPVQGTVVDIDELRKECWLGIPHKIRPLAWRILSGYIPTNLDRSQLTLKRKRDEYWHYVEQYFHTRYDEQHQTTFRQIHIDIPRMCPLIPLFQQKKVQEIFERVLYIWAIRHPASGYVQGINDLVTPFFVVFLSEFITADEVDIGCFDLSQLSREQVEVVEADSFWCVSALLDTIQDNYTFAQPGIQRKVNHLRELVSRVERNLFLHFEANGIEFIQFSFRWMNNLLMREIPLRATIRLWDTYLSERDGYSEFHTYVCGAFLRLWSKQLQIEKDFQGIMLTLQSLPTQGWGDQQICELTADAYSLMQFFHGAKSHLQ